MACDICSLDFTTRRKPVCPSCAQAALYRARLSQAQALSERSNSHIHAEAVVRPGNDGVLAALPQDANLEAITTGMHKYGCERWTAEQEVIESRINHITDKARELRAEIDAYKAYAAKQKELHQQRRQDLVVERQQLAERRAKTLESVQSESRKAERRLQRVHNKTAEGRATLCREVALLLALKRRRGEDGSSEYWLGGSPIPDLRQLNGKSTNDSMAETGEPDKLSASRPKHYEIINASLENICHLLGQCCHYLYVRLPAEIILPCENFPSAMILPERASYKSTRYSSSDVAGTTATRQTGAAPVSSTLFDRSNTPRSRPLSIDRPLPQLAKEDPKQFQMFIEGVAHLAWNIAWLCKTQGISEPSMNSFGDISTMGRNLYNLFLSPPISTSISSSARPQLDRKVSTATHKSSDPRPTAPNELRLGAYSHGTAHHSLYSLDIAKLLRDWRYAAPAPRLIDRLRNHLLSDLAGREWDLVGSDEWEEERDDEKAVLVGGDRAKRASAGPAMSIMTVGSPPRQGSGEEWKERDEDGGRGWMRVRTRGADGAS